MRSHVALGLRGPDTHGGTRVIPPTLNQIDENPGWIEGATDIAKGVGYIGLSVYHGFTGQWAGIAEDIKNFFGLITQGADKLATRDSILSFSKAGNYPWEYGKVSVVRLAFMAWSEDAIKPSASGRVDPWPSGIGVGSQRFYTNPRGVHYYNRWLEIDLDAVPPGVYKFAFGACDDGWHYDVAVASTVTVGIDAIDTPGEGVDTLRQGVDIGEELAGLLQSHARSGALQPKHTGERPGPKVVLPRATELIDVPSEE